MNWIIYPTNKYNPYSLILFIFLMLFIFLYALGGTHMINTFELQEIKWLCCTLNKLNLQIELRIELLLIYYSSFKITSWIWLLFFIRVHNIICTASSHPRHILLYRGLSENINHEHNLNSFRPENSLFESSYNINNVVM